jgi:hypothetical protein
VLQILSAHEFVDTLSVDKMNDGNNESSAPEEDKTLLSQS